MIKVTAESFAKNPVLRTELTDLFPGAVFWDRQTDLHTFCADAEALIVGREKIDEALLEACPRLKIISKYGVGLDNVDEEACRSHNVHVGWTPGVNKTSVAELTLAFMLGAAHNIFFTGTALKEGHWIKNGGTLLSGKTVGIIGVGHVGKEVVRLLQPFGCRIWVNDIVDQKEYYVSNNLTEKPKEEIYRGADFVTLHVPLKSDTFHLIDEHALSLFQPHAILLNTCRGETVDQEALKKALKTGTIGGALLDVFETEPCTDLEFLRQPRLFATPHIGGNALEAVLAMGRSAIAHISYFYTNR